MDKSAFKEFIATFQPVLNIKPSSSSEQSLYDFIQGWIELFRKEKNLTLVDLRKTLFYIMWLKDGVEPQFDSFFSYALRANNRGALYQRVGESMRLFTESENGAYKRYLLSFRSADSLVLCNYKLSLSDLESTLNHANGILRLTISNLSVDGSKLETGMWTYFYKINLYPFLAMKRLLELDLSCNHLENFTHPPESQLKILEDIWKKIWASHEPITMLKIGTLIGNFSILTKLNLSSNFLSDLSLIDILTGIRGLKSLVNIDLSQNLLQLSKRSVKPKTSPDPENSGSQLTPFSSLSNMNSLGISANYSVSPFDLFIEVVNIFGERAKQNKNEMVVNLSCNYIDDIDEICQKANAIIISEPRQVECLFWPLFFVSPAQAVVTLYHPRNKVHTHMIEEKMHAVTGQLKLVMHHLVKNDDRSDRVKSEIYDPIRFFRKLQQNKIWEVHTLDPQECANLENLIHQRRKNAPSINFCIPSANDDETNCAAFGASTIYAAKKKGPAPQIIIPTFALVNSLPRHVKRDYYIPFDHCKSRTGYFMTFTEFLDFYFKRVNPNTPQILIFFSTKQIPSQPTGDIGKTKAVVLLNWDDEKNEKKLHYLAAKNFEIISSIKHSRLFIVGKNCESEFDELNDKEVMSFCSDWRIHRDAKISITLNEDFLIELSSSDVRSLSFLDNSLSSGRSLPDGNCAFNAFALAIIELLQTDTKSNLNVFDELTTELHNQQTITEPSIASLRHWLYTNQGQSICQIELGRALRKLAVKLIRHNSSAYDRLYLDHIHYSYNEFVKKQSYNQEMRDANQDRDDTFIVHPFIQSEFSRIQSGHLSDIEAKNDLVAWWQKNSEDSGKNQYFGILSETAEGSSDIRRYGSDVEITALALHFRFNILVKTAAVSELKLVFGSGFIFKNNLDSIEIEQLREHQLGDLHANYFVLANFVSREKLRQRLVILAEDVPENLQERVKNHLGRTTRGFSDDEVKILKSRNVLTNDLSTNEAIFIDDRARILQNLKGIGKQDPSRKLVEKVLFAYCDDIPLIKLSFHAKHWDFISLAQKQPLDSTVDCSGDIQYAGISPTFINIGP
jgi:hypothetical protein